jgi:hypothetical protein
MDLGSATRRKIGGGRIVVASFAASVSMNSSTENATMELQIVALPKTTIATATFTAATTDIITATAHGLTAGTRITVSSSTTLPAGLAASTNYYLRDVTTNTFKVSLTPNGSAVDITDTGTGTHTLTWYPEVLVSSGPIGIDRIQAGLFKCELAVPPPQVSPRYPYNQYLFARFVPSATITAGTMTCDLNDGYATDGGHAQPAGYTTA